MVLAFAIRGLTISVSLHPDLITRRMLRAPLDYYARRYYNTTPTLVPFMRMVAPMGF